MSDFLNYIKKKEDLVFLNGVSDDEIKEAEKEMKLKFSNEYVDFLKCFRTASFSGNEIIGLCDSKRLNVINVTNVARKKNPYVPSNLYVIEDLNVDNSYIWQDEIGIVYKSYENGMPEKVAKSLLDYYQYMEQ